MFTMAAAHPTSGVSDTRTRPYAQLTQTRRKEQALYPVETPEPCIHSIYEPQTGTWQYVVADASTKKAIIIDSVLDYDAATRTIRTSTADALLSLVAKHRYHIDKIVETHAHADHLTAASYLQHRLSQRQGSTKPNVGIGKRINQVQELFGKTYGIAADEYKGVFDELFEDDETFHFGNLTAKVIHLPGHTPDHVGYQIADNVFCGDTIFHADIGSARCDFPGGNARSLYASARKLLALPDDVKIWTGHDYPASLGRREAIPCMTVREHREKNTHLSQHVEEEDFLRLRQQRDAGLAAPKLLHASLQMNIRAGRLPRPTAGGSVRFVFRCRLRGRRGRG
ncbi:hypothetical protein CFE70_006943 [Pyrenophora teres f. teres 0-1]